MTIFERGMVSAYVAYAMEKDDPDEAFYMCGACGERYRAQLSIYVGEWVEDHVGNALCFRCLEDLYQAVADHVQENGEGRL